MSAAKSVAPVTAPVIPSLFAAAQQLRAVPTDYAALTERDSLLNADERGRRGAVVAGRDGLQSNPARLEYIGGRGSRLDEVLAALEGYIASEQCVDVRSDWVGLRLDRRDGYMFRAPAAGEQWGGPGAPITEHAQSQLCGILKAGGTGQGITSATLAGVSPAVRELLLLELQATSKRERTVEGNVVARTALRTIETPDPVRRFGAERSITTRTERVIRAIVTPRHSGTAFDDLNIARVLREVAGPASFAAFIRAELGTESRGWVEVTGDSDQMQLGEVARGLTTMVSFRNSETGQARLSFRGSCRISALDAVVVAHRGVVIDEAVEIAATTGRSDRNHTLPTVLTRDLAEAHPTMPSARSRTGSKLTAADRDVIAADRMKESFELAADGAVKLAAAWTVALTSYAPGFDPSAFKGLDAAGQAEVLLDMCEEKGITVGDDRAALAKVLTDDKRLMSLLHGSAAHVAACYAVLAAHGTKSTVDGKEVTSRFTWEEAERLQQAAGRWVACGWDAKAHRVARGEQD